MSKKKATSTSLPLSRTAKIMTSAVGVESVNNDIVALATKATEIFLMDLAQRAYQGQSPEGEFSSNVLEYEDIHRLVHSDSRYDFLADSIPKRIKFSEALKLVEEAKEVEAQRLEKVLLERAKQKKAKLDLEKSRQENIALEKAHNNDNNSQTEQENQLVDGENGSGTDQNEDAKNSHNDDDD